MKKLSKENLRKIKEKVGKGVRSGYLREMAASVHPKNYSSLASNSVWHGLKYIMVIMLISFLVMSLISVPKIFGLPSAISSQLQKFDRLNISADVEMRSPVLFPESNPQVVIDTTGNTRAMSSEKLLVTNDSLYYRPYNSIVRVELAELEDVTEYKESLSNLLTFIAVLVIPSFLITSYLVFLIKYIVLVLAGCIAVFVFSRLIKKDIGIRRSLMVAAYASTVMIVIEVLFVPFNIPLVDIFYKKSQ